jgi:putative transposase
LEGGIRKRTAMYLAGCLPYLWRTIKYEEVYIKDYASPRDAREGLRDYLRFYNEQRLHQALEYRTPAEVYFAK